MAAALIAALTVTVSATSSFSSAFVAWRVTGVSADDLLNVRAYPSSGSRILVGYPNGTRLSMTGRCTGGVRLDELQGLPSWQQREAVRYSWCETWLDPRGTGEFRNGWVYGKFIRPA
jgi:hypothetical protein